MFDTDASLRPAELPSNRECLALPLFEKFDAILVNVPVDFQQGPVADGEEPPFGLGRIAAVANEYFGLHVGILDVHRIFQNGHKLTITELTQQFTEIKKRMNPGFIVGLNPTNVNVEAGMEVAKILDELEIPYVIGGYFATLSDANTVFENFPNAVGFIPRHGEVAFSSVVACRVDGKSTNSLAGFYTQKDLNQPRSPFGRKIGPTHAPPIDQLAYFYRPFTQLDLNGKTYTEASTYLTDGCPFECGFCSSPYMKERQYERPTIVQIVDEVERLVKQGANAIHFLDDLVFIKENDINEFHQEIIKRGLLDKFVWRGMGRANLIDRWSDDTMRKLKETGCWQLAIGVESGSSRILSFIRKKIDPEMVVRATQKNTQFGIGTKGFFIFGFPTETDEDMQQTLQLAVKMAECGATSIAAFEFHPYPGTALYHWLAQHRPDVIGQLSYLTTDKTSIGKDDTIGVEAKAVIKKTGMWLGENVCIADVPSIKVREYVQRTIEEFYKTKRKRNLT